MHGTKNPKLKKIIYYSKSNKMSAKVLQVPDMFFMLCFSLLKCLYQRTEYLRLIHNHQTICAWSVKQSKLTNVARGNSETLQWNYRGHVFCPMKLWICLAKCLTLEAQVHYYNYKEYKMIMMMMMMTTTTIIWLLIINHAIMRLCNEKQRTHFLSHETVYLSCKV
jgi:hypothetical protein